MSESPHAHTDGALPPSRFGAGYVRGESGGDVPPTTASPYQYPPQQPPVPQPPAPVAPAPQQQYGQQRYGVDPSDYGITPAVPAKSSSTSTLRKVGRGVAKTASAISIIIYHIFWGGIAVAGAAVATHGLALGLIATLVGVALLILFWMTGWMLWIF